MVGQHRSPALPPPRRSCQWLLSTMRTLLRLLLLLLCPAVALAAPVPLCPGQAVELLPDGRMLGHLPYTEAPPVLLVSAPPGFAVGQPCLLRPAAARDLQALLAAAQLVPGVAGKLHGISCYRSVERQRAVFCRGIGARRANHDAADRARESAPPAFSEHATGFALDFALAPPPGCHDLEPCVAGTTAGRWMLAFAPMFGFELSFPQNNIQGVMYEPWHWRWVGTSELVPGAIEARALFARARMDFPANPGLASMHLAPTPTWLLSAPARR
jgi:zinc D-Ala-D-Ala carboxypeptidase